MTLILLQVRKPFKPLPPRFPRLRPSSSRVKSHAQHVLTSATGDFIEERSGFYKNHAPSLSYHLSTWKRKLELSLLAAHDREEKLRISYPATRHARAEGCMILSEVGMHRTSLARTVVSPIRVRGCSQDAWFG